jgi:hypothetical protein
MSDDDTDTDTEPLPDHPDTSMPPDSRPNPVEADELPVTQPHDPIHDDDEVTDGT